MRTCSSRRKKSLLEAVRKHLDVRADLIDCFPPTGLPEVLMEVDQWAKLREAKHLVRGAARCFASLSLTG